jgi:hypothetical protein
MVIKSLNKPEINKKMAVFWVIRTMVKAADASETSEDLYQTTRLNNPEDGHLYTSRRENMKSDTNKYRNFDVLKVGVTRG